MEPLPAQPGLEGGGGTISIHDVLPGVQDASAEAMSRQLQAAEETARELEQELRRKEQELQQKDAEAAAAARAADSRRQGSPVRVCVPCPPGNICGVPGLIYIYQSGDRGYRMGEIGGWR